jgi:hypothetical protein
MATIVKTPLKKTKPELERELKNFALAGRDPDKATEELFGMWKGRNISTEKIREKNNRNKWL